MASKPFVKVTWIDASDPQGDHSWYKESEIEKFGEEVCEVVSFGYLVRRTKLYVTLAADEVIKGVTEITFGRPTKIPIGMIVSEEVILPPDPIT